MHRANEWLTRVRMEAWRSGVEQEALDKSTGEVNPARTNNV